MTSNSNKSILLFEPENKGHHLQYLQYLTEDFLSGGFRVSVAFDRRTPEAADRLNAANPELLAKTNTLCAYTESQGRPRPRNRLKAAFQCLAESGADELFLCCLDEVSSALLRRAAFGLFPPKGLRGRTSGIYIRPRPLDPTQPLSGNLRLKRGGMQRLLKQSWFKNIYLLDEFLCAELQQQTKTARFVFLPDVANPPDNVIDRETARDEFGIPVDKTVLLHYGTGTRRKGLPLVLQALATIPNATEFHLVVAGRQENSNDLLNQLQNNGQATLLNRFVSESESNALFSAADWILLPYINHYGASNVLARAALANRPVIASDYHLLGKRVDEYHTGICFRNNDVADLGIKLEECLHCPENAFANGLSIYAKRFAREAFRDSLLEPYR